MNCAFARTDRRADRRHHRWVGIGAVVLLLVAAVAPARALDIPFLSAHVNDLAGMLTPAARDQAETVLVALKAEKGSQVAVLTIATLDGEALEDYSHRVAETWKLGRGSVDDGALLLIVRDDRKMRIEVGYGLEPHLTDLTTGRILNDVVRPRFRGGDFSGGILAGVEAIAGVVRGQDVLPPSGGRAGDREMSRDSRVTLVFVAVMFAVQALTSRFPWLIYLMLSPFLFWLGGGLGKFLLLAWLIGFPPIWLVMRNSRVVESWRRQGSGDSWRSGGGSGGGWSSGGGFSGGGGSFGGGGASSSW